jgi:hypothetical protein
MTQFDEDHGDYLRDRAKDDRATADGAREKIRKAALELPRDEEAAVLAALKR